MTDRLLHSLALLCLAVCSSRSPAISPPLLSAELQENTSGNARTFETVGGSQNLALSVLLLSVDTLRADYLGCYGHPFPASPHVDRLAQESLVFEDCVCEAPLTCPSFCAMLTSRAPRMIGTPRNGLRLPADIPLITEQFHAAGYYTFCVQSNWTLKKKLSGLDRGFDVYEDNFHKKRWGIIKPERIADEVTRVALACLAKRDPHRPFFAWIHYTDPHAPYHTHKGFNPAGKRAWLQDKTGRVRVAYNSEVAFTDAEIGKLLAALPENTAIVFVADHGESLYEHDYLGHGRRIYQDGLRIPLIIRAPNVVPGRTSVPARGLDIGPTLLGLAGLAKVPGMLGLDLLRNQPSPDRKRIVETYGGAVPKVPGAKALMADRKPIRQGFLWNNWKLIIDGRKSELFFLPEDPGELNNLAAKQPERVAEMRAMIQEWDTATEHGKLGAEEISEDDLKALESLGYLE